MQKIVRFEDIFMFYKSFSDFSEFFTFLDKKLANMKQVLNYLQMGARTTIDTFLPYARD